MATSERRDYKSTLNLPKTAFPMKANLAQAEPATLKRWEAEGLYAKVIGARAGAEPYVFHDGPPYANGSIHVGHLLNKVLKDLVVRSVTMEGRRCAYVPGWDCHGLPIEHRVVTALVESGKAAKLDALPADTRRMAIRRECAAYAQKFIGLQATQMKRLLTMADYDHPYMTMQPEYEAGTLEVFARLLEEGFVYRDLKPVHWSIANRTALAEAELEYEDRKDTSVYVDFEVADREGADRAFGTESPCTPCLMIWTTTPWTLPANLAVAVHPRFRYALAEVDGAVTIVATELLKKVSETIGAEKVSVLAECDGSALVGLTYRHPFCEREGRVVAAEYVTLEDGTGLVHTAPGHGQEDYQTGLREGLPVYCPVREDGTYDDSVPEWLRGISVWDANALVTERLRESGHLVFDHTFVHSYPHDWRSKTPVIFRATEQWFVGVDRPGRASGPSKGRTLRQMALEAVERHIDFAPEWGRNRLRGMLEHRPDWCISRQRAWGLPIPAFTMPDGRVFMTPASVRAVAARFAQAGSDAWFTETPAQLLASYDAARDPDAPAGLDVGTLVRLPDIFDVWFEAGSSWHSVLQRRGFGVPSELYLEGSDQHRGWFQLSLLPALGATGAPPFKALLTHGFMVDRNGHKMSKSLGNALDVEDLLKEFGAEVARWWVSGLAYDADIRIDTEYFRIAGESYRKVRNTIRFLLSNLDGEAAGPADDATLHAWARAADPASIDGWIVAELARVEHDVRHAFAQWRFRDAHLAIFRLCNETLSAVYCAAVKDRLYCDAADAPRRRSAQRAMRLCAEALCRMLAPILPHTAEEAWRAMRGESAPMLFTQVHMGLDSHAEGAIPAWTAAMAVRDTALKALDEAKSRGVENPLDAGLVIADPSGELSKVLADLADLMGVSRVRLDAGLGAGQVHVEDLRGEPRCERSWRRDGTVRQRSDGGMLSDRDAAAVGV